MFYFLDLSDLMFSDKTVKVEVNSGYVVGCLTHRHLGKTPLLSTCMYTSEKT
jgi:hypothetical protein